MAIDAKKVLVGAPDQSSTTGAVNVAPLGTTLPTDAKTALSGDYAPTGYVSQDGLTLSLDYSTNDIKDWSRATVRTLLEEFTGELNWVYIQTDYEGLCAIFGDEHVSKAGDLIKVSLGAHLAPAKVFVFNMKDDDTRIRVIAPNAQAVPDGDLTFVANEPISWGCRLSCNADENGENIYILVEEAAPSSSGLLGA